MNIMHNEHVLIHCRKLIKDYLEGLHLICGDVSSTHEAACMCRGAKREGEIRP